MMGIITSVLLSGAGASFILLFLARMVPNDKLHDACVRIGRLLTMYGRSRLGKSFWEKFEDFVENSISVCWEGLREGFNSDDVESAEKVTK